MEILEMKQEDKFDINVKLTITITGQVVKKKITFSLSSATFVVKIDDLYPDINIAHKYISF